MKIPISLWLFGIVGVITNIISGVIFYPPFYIYTQLSFFVWVAFLVIAGLFIPFQIVLYIGILKLQKWARNIFVIITLVMNSLLILLLLLGSFFLAVIIIAFLVCFIMYFFEPSTRKLFNVEK